MGMAESHEIKVLFNANHHPQTNPTERINRVIKTMIASYVKENQRHWDVNLPKLGFALRTATHEVTGFPPVFLNLGRQLHLSGKIHGQAVDEEDPIIDIGERAPYVSHLRDVHNLYENVKERLNEAYQKNKSRYDVKRRESCSYKVGEIVLRRNFVQSNKALYFSAKLAPKFVKCKIKCKTSPLTYEVTDLRGINNGIWHVKDLKKCYV
jgi:hypothetical protein